MKSDNSPCRGMVAHGRQVGSRDTGLGVAATSGRVLCVAAVTDCWVLLSLKLEPREKPALEEKLF